MDPVQRSIGRSKASARDVVFEALTEFHQEALKNVESQTDGEYAEKIFNKHEEENQRSRRESYMSAMNLLTLTRQQPLDWQSLTPLQLQDALLSSMQQGLSEKEAANRLAKYGPNELKKPKRPTFLMLFALQILNLICMLLVVAACASLIVNATSPDRADPLHYTDSIAIFIIVIINAGIGAYSENAAAGALEALSKLTQPKATVVRDGQEVQIPSTKIVRGDLVLLQVGDIVPADVRLIEADDLKVNEMLLTGEPDDVAKFARMKKKAAGEDPHGEKLTPENMAFSSCLVANGKCRGFVVETGMNTKVGKIAQLLSQSGDVVANEPKFKNPEEALKAVQQSKKRKPWCKMPDIHANQTPLQRSLQSLGVKIGVLSILACVVVFIVGIARKTNNINTPEADGWGDIVIYMLLVAVTLAVAAIPEGIPICVTISLATGCSDMVKQKVLVRRIAAVETLGCASVICTDKTGTLTEGKMTMVKMFAAGQDFNVSGKGFDPTVGKVTYKTDNSDAKDHKGVRATLGSAVLCSDAKIVLETDPDDGTKKWVPYGNSSEAPIIVAGHKVGIESAQLEKHLPRIFEVPFSSKRKMMLTVNEIGKSSDSNAFVRALFPGFFAKNDVSYFGNVKGAPNFILTDCDSWMKPDGSVVPLTQADRDLIMGRVDTLSSEALRVLAIALRPMSEQPFDFKDKELEWTTDEKFESIVKKPGLCFLGLVASIDPERDGVPQAVLDAQGGHIRVIMITGDYLPTAIAIGHNVNILLKDDDHDACALDCGKLRPDGKYLPDDEFDILTKTVKCFARAQPEDKLEIVKSLQRQGLVCAMTGDGVNDAPALNKADIGVAMGLQGTEVAKGASDMILTDDNFCSIVGAVEKGRIIYSGIQKFVAFILSVHIAEVAQIFLCIVADIPIMRTPLQILFLILVTDLPPSVALGMERVARDILKDRPRPKTQPVVMMWQWRGILASALVLVLTTFAVYIWGLSHYLDNHFTVKEIGQLICDDACRAMEEPKFNEDALERLRHARTAAFVSLVYSDNIRAYASRSFVKPIWEDLCTNPAMQKAIGFAQIGMYIAVFVPGLSDEILEFEGVSMGWEGWVAAWLGGISTMILCEVYKFISKADIAAAEKKVRDDLEMKERERELLMEKRAKGLKDEAAANAAAKTNGNHVNKS